MKKTLKITSIALALVLVLGMFAMAFAADSASGVSIDAVSGNDIVQIDKTDISAADSAKALATIAAGEKGGYAKSTGYAKYTELEKVLGAQYTFGADGKETKNWDIADVDVFDLEPADDNVKSATVTFTANRALAKGEKLVVLHWTGSAWQVIGQSKAATEVKADGKVVGIDGANPTVKVTTTFSPFATAIVSGAVAATTTPAGAAPQTGDSSIALWGALMMVAAVAAVSTVVVSKKHKNEA